MHRRILTAASAVLVVGTAGTSATNAAAAGNRLSPYTLRQCIEDPTRPSNIADPVNVAFIGTHASWQNSQRLVGKDGGGPELKWRTTYKLAAGGVQQILDDRRCKSMNAQSVRGFGLRDDEKNTKRHTRYFEQFTPFTTNADGSLRALRTAQDAHRDVKRAPCKGPGSAGPLNDAVPRDIDGFPGGGFDSAQRLFIRAFPSRRGLAERSPERGRRFVQCASEAPPRRYSVRWNGIVQRFVVDDFVECQGDWSRRFLPDVGKCPTERGREGTVK